LNIGLGRPDEHTGHSPDKSGAATIARGLAELTLARAERDVYITNSLPYVREIEYTGHSSQAPSGVVRITVANYQAYLAKAVAGFT